MRKIEQEMVNAIEHGESWSKANTMVAIDSNSVLVYLHGNLICKVNGELVTYNHCGWHTPTTRSRLNALASVLTPSIGFRIKNYYMQCAKQNANTGEWENWQDYTGTTFKVGE